LEHVTLPGIDATQLNSLAGQIKRIGIGSLNMFTGGAFSKASVCFGIMPYISFYCCSANGIAIPYLQNFKVMASGRKKINQITRWLIGLL
jgi:preprotein translocase subunit SecY